MTKTLEQRMSAVRDLPKADTRRTGSPLEVRDTGDISTFQVGGYAIVWDQPYFYGSATNSADDALFTEYCRRGMTTKTLAEGDQRLLSEHGGMALARTKSGTLSLREDDHGLYMEATLDAANPTSAALRSALGRGDVDGMSFGFQVMRQAWDADYTVRDLLEVRLDEVSIVTFPAYTSTSVGLRSAELMARLDTELRAGKVLSAANVALLEQVLEHLTNADESLDTVNDALDEAQAVVSDLLGVANPDPDVADDSADDTAAERSTVTFAQYKRQLEIARLRRR